MATTTTAEDASDSERSDWRPTRKPCLPYKKGFKITAMRHEPPEPFGLGYNTQCRPSPKGWKEMSQTDYCISCPPLEGRTDPDVCKSLTITSTIRTGQHKGAQIVVVNDTMVAKIFDPLYYSHFNEYHTVNDVVYDADSDYCHEAAAFTKLQESAQARAVIPAYYGTWTMDIENPVKVSRSKRALHTRAVRLILMERLNGICMVNIDPFDLRKKLRSTILKKVIVAETLMYDAGVDHRDLSPRNIMISGFDYDHSDVPISDAQVEVKIMDFNIAEVITHPMYADSMCLGPLKRCKQEWPSKLYSPIIRYYGHMAEFSTEGWCSNDDRDAEKWLWRHFRNDDRYVPVIWDPDHPRKRPVHQKPAEVQAISVSVANFGASSSQNGKEEGSSSGEDSQKGSDGSNESDTETVSTEPDEISEGKIPVDCGVE
jgi:hypothetical protein